MRDIHKIDDQVVSKPLNASNFTVTAVFQENSLAEVQPALNVDSLIWGKDAKDRILEQLAAKGRYRKIYYDYEFNNVNYLRGYLSDINYKMDRDQIQTSLSIENDTNNLAGLLEAINADILIDDYKFTDLEVIVQKIDINNELVQLSIARLTQLYILYNQVFELVAATAELVAAATPSAAGPDFGAIALATIKLVPRIVFFANTLRSIIENARELKELILPRVRIAKTISLHELIRAPLELIGYNIQTNITDMFDTYYLERGELDRNVWTPRPDSQVYSGNDALNFILKKFNAKVRVLDNTVFIYQEFDDFFFNNTNFKISSYFPNNFTENTDDQVGFRQILYSTDTSDRYTEINYIGSNFVVIARPESSRSQSSRRLARTESTLKGADIIEMGVGLCTRKETLSTLEKAWKAYIGVVNSVISAFGGSSQSIRISTRIGAAIFDTNDITVARICRIQNKKLPSNNRTLLSALTDYTKYYHTRSLVSNPRARYKLYTGDNAQLISFNQDDLNKVISNGYIVDEFGNRGKILNELKWQADKDNTVLEFKIEDPDREMGLVEEGRLIDYSGQAINIITL